MLNPNRQACQKFRSLILENSSQMLFSSDRQFHEFQEGKVRPAEESEYVDRLAWRKWNGHRENSRRPRSTPPSWTQRRTREADDRKIKSAKKLIASGVPPRDVASNLGVSLPTLYRWIPASTHP